MSISISIDVSKINKEWLVVGKTGVKYLAIDVYENKEPDRYGNTHAVKQTPPKDVKAAMKAAGERTPYIGNGKDWSMREAQPQATPRSRPTEAQLANQEMKNGSTIETDEVPF